MSRINHSERGACAILIVLMFFTCGAAPTPQEVALRNSKAQRYLQYAAAVRERVLTPASCPFSPASIVLVAGNDPAELTDWVMKHIAYQPYAGVVRGAEGTLAARSGGDWDRAVLLQALLSEAGYRSRLKVAPRTPEEAGALVDGFLKGSPAVSSWFAGAQQSAAPSAAPIPLVQQFGAVPENRRLYAAEAMARTRRLVGECLDAAAGQTPRLMDSLDAKPGQSFEAWRAKLLSGAGERVEVELQTPQGARILSAAPERAPPEAARLASAKSFDAPPGEKVAKLSIRLELTAGEDGKPPAAPVALLSRELPLGGLFCRPIRLEVVPSDDAAAAKPAAEWTQADWSKFVAGFKDFQAILRVGDEWEGSRVFDTSGGIHTVSADGRIEGASHVGGAVGSGFGGFGLGGGSSAAPKGASRLQSLVLKLELTVPGEPPQIQQRLIYGKDRPDVTPVFTADALVMPGPVSAHASTWLLLDAVTRNAPLTTRLITSQDSRRFEQTADAVRFPAMLYDWHALRLMAAHALMAAESGVTILSGPSLVLHSTHLTMDASTHAVGTRHAMDVVFDRTMLLPRDADKVEQAALANMQFGIAATVLESELLRRIDPAQGTRGAYSAFEDSQAAGITPIALAPGADAAAVKPAAIVAWSIARNEPGRALVFAGEGASAWWSIDPATGSTVGRGDGGEGQSAMEYLQITKKNVENLKCMVGFSNQMISGDSRGETAKQWFLCMTGTDNAGNGNGIPGGVEGMLDPDEKVLEIGIGPLADALGGAKDLYDIMNKDDPVIFSGR
jgi:hypothetical protein